ncbi:MAG: FtsH protease activity modulator HflK [candidate division Zixibacteria bacterium]|nr:FtsH protease activity modulator HflK [candidate division Zixibacteria bacterium]
MRIHRSSRRYSPEAMLRNSLNRKRLWIAGGIVVLIFLSTGFYTIESGQEAVILRFGKPVGEAREPGVHYHIPYPIETALKVHVHQVQKVMLQEPDGNGVETLTGDENLILITAVINYDVKNLRDYLFNVRDVKMLVESASKSELFRQVAELSVDEVMTTGKSILRLLLKEEIQKILDRRGSGVRIISIELADISPPQWVIGDFKAVSNAREKKQRIIKDAEGYANEVIPMARGEASSILSSAQAYSSETVSLARAKVSSFNALYSEYINNPTNTTTLMYLETIKRIYKSCRIIVDSNPDNTIYYIGKAGTLKQIPESEKKGEEDSGKQ